MSHPTLPNDLDLPIIDDPDQDPFMGFPNYFAEEHLQPINAGDGAILVLPEPDPPNTFMHRHASPSVASPPSKNHPFRIENDVANAGNITKQWKCEHLSCTYKKSFKRLSDLKRHSLKHDRNHQVLKCPVQGCSCGGKTMVFSRWDMLKSHLQKGHFEHELCICPQENCGIPPVPLFLLRLHMGKQHGRNHVYGQAFGVREYIHGPSSFQRRTLKCDLKRCKKIVKETIQDMQAHLGTHDREDRRLQANIIEDMGFEPMTLHIICPICQMHLPSAHLFGTHFKETHLIRDPELWSKCSESSKDLFHIRPWEMFLPARVCREGGFGCQEDQNSHTLFLCYKHFPHLALEPFKQNRNAIVRLLPYFADHPAFHHDEILGNRRASD